MAKQKYAVDELNIHSYTTSDKEYVFANSKKNKEGFPYFYPSKNAHNRRVALSFVDAHIEDAKGNVISKENGNFDILGDEIFDSKDPLSSQKLDYIVAILNPNVRVKGGVYYHGKLIANKITPKSALGLMKAFLNEYFRLEDGPIIEKAFQGFSNDHLPFWPSRSLGDDKIVFVAHKATVSDANGANQSGPYDFTIRYGDIFDLSKEEDLIKAKVLRDLFDEKRVVKGFYYKGKLLEDKLSKEYKLYLERAFIKKNFTVEDRTFLEENFHHDERTGALLYFPMQNKEGRQIAISVRDARENGGEPKSFDLYNDAPFELSEENIANLDIVSALYYGKDGFTGSLYFDGVLVNGSGLSNAEKERRKDKSEAALKIHVSDSGDFSYLNKNYFIDDRDKLIRLSGEQDNYYPSSHNPVDERKPYKEGDKELIVDDVNLVDQKGDYAFEKGICATFGKGESASEEVKAILLALYHKDKKVRGGIFYKGKPIQKGRGVSFNLFDKEFLPEFVEASFLNELHDKSKVHPFSIPFQLDPRYNMPQYWPTNAKDGREVLLSVVDADIHFHNANGTVKAVNNATFDIYEGETFGLVGESGSGKTTISRAILGINKLTKGGIYFKGKLISAGLKKGEKKKTKKNIQMIFQDPAASLNERANVDYIISEGLYNFHLFKSKQERLEKVVSMLRSVGLLPEHLSRYPHEFSGGQRQRIGIARALIIEPRLVLADEPISALDVSIRAQILNLLKKMQNEQGLTYLFIAHDLSIIRYISDRIAVMHAGYIVELGPAEEIYSNPLHPYTRSLLTAIPQPDPRSKNDRKKIVYDKEKEGIDYETCVWKEMKPGHFVYVNDRLEKQIKERIAAQDGRKGKGK